MADEKWVLTDTSDNTWIEAGELPPQGKTGSVGVSKRTLRGGLREGVDVIHVDNGALAFDILPTRGMGIWKAWAAGEEIGWKSPIPGPVHPKFVPLSEPSGLGWLDGFDELLVRCGLESNGAPEFDDKDRLKYPLHGRLANKPAHRVVVTRDPQSGVTRIQGEVDEARFHFLKLRLVSTITVRPGEAAIHIRDEVRNLSALPAEAQLLYHVNFGAPLLDPGARVVAPVKTLVPRNARAAGGIRAWDSFQADTPGFEEQVYFFELLADAQQQTEVLLKNAHGTRGVSLAFNKKQLPCFTLWKDTAAMPDGYVTGLEPGTNYPNPRSFEGEQGRVARLAPGASTSFDLRLAVQRNPAEVEQAELRIGKLRGPTEPRVFDEPQAGWVSG